MSQAEQLHKGLMTMGLDLPVERHESLLTYISLLYKWNKTYRLTALREQDKAVSHHLLDSLSIFPILPVGDILDVGSGGGTPGIPLAIACPERKVTLIDSNSKKTAFLRQVAIELDLTNISVHCGRVEQYHPVLGGFAVIVSRAFAELRDFVDLSRHLLRPEGSWLAMKGVWPREEITRLPNDVRVQAVYPLSVPGVDGERHVVEMRVMAGE